MLAEAREKGVFARAAGAESSSRRSRPSLESVACRLEIAAKVAVRSVTPDWLPDAGKALAKAGQPRRRCDGCHRLLAMISTWVPRCC